jgi:hypothetical protein
VLVASSASVAKKVPSAAGVSRAARGHRGQELGAVGGVGAAGVWAAADLLEIGQEGSDRGRQVGRFGSNLR